MPLIDSRVKEMFYLFSKILPIYSEKQKKIIEKRLKIKLDEVAPSILLSIANDCLDPFNKEAAEGYFHWITQACLYMTGESDDYPETLIIHNDNDLGTFKNPALGHRKLQP